MINWDEYLSNIISSDDSLSQLSISLDGGITNVEIPPLIRASVSMLDKMIEKQGRLNLIVFPERIQSIFIFTMMKLFHNISVGKIQSKYDPAEFKIGEKLKVGNAVVEYSGNEIIDGQQFLIIKTSNTTYHAPENLFAIFQKVTTNRRLSSWNKYVDERNKALKFLSGSVSTDYMISHVADMKTHMDSSIFTMTAIAPVKEQLSRCLIDGEKTSKIFYIAQANYDGEISNISPGQMGGIPAIVFSSDLYAIEQAVEKKNPIQSIIIDASNTNTLMNQLDALDELIKLNVPIVCITDVANSFDLDAFSSRGFNIWRWDNKSITTQLYENVSLSSSKKTKNCANHKTEFLKTEDTIICGAMKKLFPHRKETESQSPQMMKLFERLNNLIFTALRSTIPFSDTEISYANDTLLSCEKTLDEESLYLSPEIVDDYSSTISLLKQVYISDYQFNKTFLLEECLKKHRRERIALIIPEKSSKAQIQAYWNNWISNHYLMIDLRVLFPSEYYGLAPNEVDLTIISGWLKRAIMKKIIYSFNTTEYVVLLYEYENKWKKHDSRRWEKALSNNSNKRIIEKAFSTREISVSTQKFEEEYPVVDIDEPDELGEIELIIRENKYKQYVNNGSRSAHELINAIPVNFVGGYLSFYRIGHKIVSATKIITSDSDKIETIPPTELKVGDFIVVRESDKDLVRDLADIILKNSGLSNYRTVATKWREALRIELLFCSEIEFYEKLQKVGCTRGLPTVKRWIEDEEVIAPQSKDDLEAIALATGNETLLEMLDSIYEAAQVVKKAHIQAGKKISEQLKLTIAEELKKHDVIDPFNIWDAIDMEVDGIGNVKILKIIDIGTELQIDPSDTNRLIEE